MDLPEQGQLVRLRNRFFLVRDVDKKEHDGEIVHKVSLEHINDDRFGDILEVIWEREINPKISSGIDLPKPSGKWDMWKRFRAFINSISWTTSSFIEGPELMSPFQSGISLEPHQLEPVIRGLGMPRVNLLIADDVGLGKTIEAGLVAQELLSRQLIKNILVICPASLQQQWQDEMIQKFQLQFNIIDRHEIQKLKREYGIHVNPWTSYPFLITSMDFLKKTQVKESFKASLKRENGRVLKDWGLLILDEAHNVAPSGRQNYIQDSDRTKMMKDLMDVFEHRLFLTATPHNGYTHSFTALLEMLDPLRFCRSDTVDPVQVQTVMVRRLKDQIENALGEKIYPERHVESITVVLSKKEEKLFSLLNQYIYSRLNYKGGNVLATKFALTLLKKRLLSSVAAFNNTLNVHVENMKSKETGDEGFLKKLIDESGVDHADDEERRRIEDETLLEATKFFTELSSSDRKLLKEMAKLSKDSDTVIDSKAQTLIDWVEKNIRVDGKWSDRRLIIFTEYKDTLDHLTKIMDKKGWGKNICQIFGGMGRGERENIKSAFQEHPDKNDVRILISTDAAAEGLNLQNHCNHLIHYEIPWNPNKLEQRNGRIDRHGQREKDVYTYHFVYKNNEDSEFLQRIAKKVHTIRNDLGTMGDVIAEQVENKMMGRRVKLNLDARADKRRHIHDEAKASIITKQQIQNIQKRVMRTRDEMGLKPDNLSNVLEQALQMTKSISPQNYLTKVEVEGVEIYRLSTALPESWNHLNRYIQNNRGEQLGLVFDHNSAKGRSDVAFIHLHHPLMKKATSIFRRNIWSMGLTDEQKLSRVSYNIVPSTSLRSPVLISYSRILAISEKGEKLHEEVVCRGYEIDREELLPIEGPLSEKIGITGKFEAIPSELGSKLSRFFEISHKRIIKKDQLKIKSEKEKEIRKLMKEKGRKDAADVKKLLMEREKEIVANIERQSKIDPQTTLADWNIVEKEQFEDDMRWLRLRLEKVREKQKTEPERIKSRYKVKSVEHFPIGIGYLIPDSYIGGA